MPLMATLFPQHFGINHSIATPGYVSVLELQKLLRIIGFDVGRSTIYRWIGTRKLKSVKLFDEPFNRMRIPVGELEKISPDLFEKIKFIEDLRWQKVI